MLYEEENVLWNHSGDAVARECPLELQCFGVGNASEWNGPQLSFTHSRAPASGVQQLPQRVERRFGDRLRQGRMRVNSEVDFLDGVFVLSRDCQLVNELGRVCADDVRTEYLAVLGIADDLDETFSFARRARAAVRREGKLSNLVVDLLFLHLLLGHSDR